MNSFIKSYRVAGWIQNRSNHLLPTRDSSHLWRNIQAHVNGRKTIFQANRNQKKAGTATLRSDKTYFKSKKVTAYTSYTLNLYIIYQMYSIKGKKYKCLNTLILITCWFLIEYNLKNCKQIGTDYKIIIDYSNYQETYDFLKNTNV